MSGQQNLGNYLSQGTSAGATGFNQGLNLAGLQGNMGQNAMQNAFNAMSQGGNLLNQYLGAGLGLQGNQQQYASNLSNQYGNLTSDYLGAYMGDQKMKNDLAISKNEAMGGGASNILKSLLDWYEQQKKKKNQPNPPTTDETISIGRRGGGDQSSGQMPPFPTNGPSDLGGIVDAIPTYPERNYIGTTDWWEYFGLPDSVDSIPGEPPAEPNVDINATVYNSYDDWLNNLLNPTVNWWDPYPGMADTTSGSDFEQWMNQNGYTWD